jgi:hypothetical protein
LAAVTALAAVRDERHHLPCREKVFKYCLLK